MREPSGKEIMNSVGFTEKWYKYQGKVYVRRYLDTKWGTQEYLGEELTAFEEVPFAKNETCGKLSK